MGIAPEAVSFKPSHSGATLTGQIRGCPNVDDPMRAACGRDETAGDAFEMRRIAGRWRGRDQSRFSAHDLLSRSHAAKQLGQFALGLVPADLQVHARLGPSSFAIA
ncbi:MAG TPA: hypothetical protein PLW24_19365 [Burkholderiaceae bacterium]|jgi:hypothetical protein|nr:hypothetical protein [Thauera sp.]HNG81640.1 hypothetical protein [Burkholderiaceae bacterium]